MGVLAKRLGARLLTTHDSDEARDLAMRLDAWNKERRELEAACLEEAIAQAEDRGLRDGLVYVSADNWHAGVIGIVAGRLKDRYNRPACVVALDQGVGKGSGRSVTGVDLGAAVLPLGSRTFLINGGGHPMAAGFSVSVEREAEFARISLRSHRTPGWDGRGCSQVTYRCCGSAGRRDNGIGARFGAYCAPFGAGNPEPRFVLPSARIAKADVVGGNHVRCFLS